MFVEWMNKEEKDLYIFCLCKIKYLGKKYIYDKLCCTMQFINYDWCLWHLWISMPLCKVSFPCTKFTVGVCRAGWVSEWLWQTVTQRDQVIFTCHSLHPQNPWLIPNQGKWGKWSYWMKVWMRYCVGSVWKWHIFLFTFLSHSTQVHGLI